MTRNQMLAETLILVRANAERRTDLIRLSPIMAKAAEDQERSLIEQLRNENLGLNNEVERLTNPRRKHHA